MKTGQNFRILMTLTVLTVFATYFILNRSEFHSLADLNPWILIVIAIGVLLNMLVNASFTKFILRPFNKQISTQESFYVTLISTLGNFFAPAGAGFGFRAIYLKKRHGLSYSDYISTLSGNYIIVFIVSSFFGLISLFMLRGQSSRQFALLAIVFTVLLVGSLALTLVKIPQRVAERARIKYLREFMRNLARVTQGWRHIVSHPKLMIQLVGLTIVNFLLTTGITFAIIKSLHFNVGLAPLVLFSVLGSLSLFINITPANLGVKEAIYLFSSGVLGFSTSQILSIALIDRGVMFLVLAGLWVVSHKLKISKQSLAQ